LALHEEGRIDRDTVLEHATNPSDMKLKLQGIGLSTGNSNSESDDKKNKDIFDLKEIEEE